MADDFHLAILNRGVPAWNRWRSEAGEAIPDLSGADLRHAELPNANFSNTLLVNAILTRANLQGAVLTGANLTGADLSGVNLSQADLSLAVVWRTIFADNDFTETRGLDSIRFGAGAPGDPPDMEDVSRFIASRAEFNKKTQAALLHAYEALIDASTEQSPFHAYLGGWSEKMSAALSEAFKELSASTSKIYLFYSCFISYSTKDQEFAERLYNDLRLNGIDCWFAPHDIEGGKKLHEQIESAIHSNDRLLLILSRHSMRSEWVKTEIAFGRKKESLEKHRVLFPVSLVPFSEIQAWKCFDADTGKDSAREIREYFIPNFSDWRNSEAYEAALRRLIHDLKREIDET